MAQEFKVTFIDGNDWKIPFNFALGLHLILILGTVYMPEFMKKKPIYQDIYTIDLVTVATPEVQPQAQPQPQPKQVAPPPKPAAPVEEVVKKVSVAQPQKEKVEEIQPISIKPLKQKKIVKSNEIDQTQKKKLEELNRQRIQEAQELERQAEEAAKLAASQAVEYLKNMIRESTPPVTTGKAISNSPPSASRAQKATTVIEQQYFASIYSTLQPHWKLPEYKTWSPDLMATIVIRISRDGNITDYFFEKKSGDKLFDQFVLKTIQDGSPLPPIPSVMQKETLEVGLHFKPGSIHY